MNGKYRHAQKLFVNIVGRVIECSVIVLCAQQLKLSRLVEAHGLGRRPSAGSTRRRYKGESKKPFAGGKKGRPGSRYRPVRGERVNNTKNLWQ